MGTLNPQKLIAFLIEEFGEEDVARFPRLKAVPDTQVRFLIPAYDRLTLAERSELRRAAAKRAACHFAPFAVEIPKLTAAEEQARSSWGSTSLNRMAGAEGWDYASLNLLKKAVGWQRRFPPKPGEIVVPEEVVRRMDALESAKAADLRRLIKASFQSHLGLAAKKWGGGEYVYESVADPDRLSVEIDYGHTNGIQLDYRVSALDSATGVMLRGASIEEIFGFGLGHWDYMTAENAVHDVKTLTDFVRYLAELPARVAAFALEC